MKASKVEGTFYHPIIMRKCWVLLILFILICGCSANNIRKETFDLTATLSEQIDRYYPRFEVSISGISAMNEVLQVNILVESFFLESESVFIELDTQDGIEVINGVHQREYQISVNEPVSSSSTIRVKEQGIWLLGVWAGPSTNPHYDRINIYIEAKSDGLSIFVKPPVVLKTEVGIDENLK